MQEPLKVTLPPWRRGDGSRFQSYGVYIVRDPGESLKRTWPMEIHQGDIMLHMLDYAGPIEFIETPPEPEPIVLEYGKVEVYLDDDPSQLATRKWVCTQRQRGTGRLLILTSGTTNVQAIEMHNAAVRAMDGTP